jgi:O-antigen biosynthesis protein
MHEAMDSPSPAGADAARRGALPPVAAMLATRLPLERPSLLHHHSAWLTHLPFAAWIVAAARPAMIVELGVHMGISYCAFCEEVARQALPARCLGVDTFQGDGHAGIYGAEVLANLRAHHDPRYGGFSTLLQSSFDSALPQVAEGSVDLLHIDGLHTYDAVRHDFESWAPKMSPRGVVLFHDVVERQRDFGVWRLWDEITPSRPHFLFEHGHGLGVLAVGEPPAALAPLFGADSQAAAQIRALFAALGAAIQAAAQPPPQRSPRWRFWK